MSTSGVYGTTVDNCNSAIEKAKGKKDGCYKMRGLCYRVRDGKITHFAAYGTIYEFAYGFLVKVGEYNNRFDGKNPLRNI